jgi:hypothetical protein
MAARENIILLNKIFLTPVHYENGEPFAAFLHPQFGSPFVYPATDYRVTVRVNQEFSLNGPGKGAERVSDGWREAQFAHDGLRDMPIVVSRGYRIVTHAFEGLSVVYVGAADSRPAVETALRAAERIGPYPYDTLTVVRVPAITGAAQWGMELSGMILLSNGLFTRDSLDALMEVTYHEVVHQWFYGGVGINKMATPAIDEGLATFLSGWLSGRMIEPAQVSLALFTRGLRDYTNLAAYQEGAYREAARFFSMLFERHGEDGFFAFLNRIYSGYKGQILTYSDFVALVRELG